MLGVARQEGRMWATIAHRHAKALGGPNADISTPFTGRLHHCQCQQVSRSHHLSLGLVCFVC